MRILLAIAAWAALWGNAKAAVSYTGNAQANAITAASLSITGSSVTLLNGATVYTGGVTYFSTSTTAAAPSLVINGGNLTTTGGFTAGTSQATMTPCGMLFYISSNSVGGSTTTVSTVLTIFSTYTLQAGVITNPGEELIVECIFANSAITVGTPFQEINGPSLGQYVAAFQVTANAWIDIKAIVILQSPGFASVFPQGVQSQGNVASGAPSGLTVQMSPQNLIAFSGSSAQVFTCSGQRATGGSINFIAMRVLKGCQ